MSEIDLGDGAEALISATEVAVRETNVTWKGVREAVQVLDAADMDAYFAAALRERLKKYEAAKVLCLVSGNICTADTLRLMHSASSFRMYGTILAKGGYRAYFTQVPLSLGHIRESRQ